MILGKIWWDTRCAYSTQSTLLQDAHVDVCTWVFFWFGAGGMLCDWVEAEKSGQNFPEQHTWVLPLTKLEAPPTHLAGTIKVT